MANRKSKIKEKLFFSLFLSTFSSAANKAWSLPPSFSFDEAANRILSALGDPKTREKVSRLLIEDGKLTGPHVKMLINHVSPNDCGAALMQLDEQYRRQRAKTNLIEYLQHGKLEAIYQKLNSDVGISGSPTPLSPTSNRKIELRIARPRKNFIHQFIRGEGETIVGLDSTTIYEIFEQSVTADGKLPYPALKDGTLLVLEKAVFQQKNKTLGWLDLKINVSFYGNQGEVIELLIPVRLGKEKPEELVVISLITLASSPHFLANFHFMKAEINALMMHAHKFLIALSRNTDRDANTKREEISSVLKKLQHMAQGSFGSSESRKNEKKIKANLLSLIIEAKRVLVDTMNEQMIAQASKRQEDIQIVERTNPTISPTAQRANGIRAAVPHPQRLSPSQSYPSQSMVLYDPWLAYYFPWVHYPGVPIQNAWFSWWVIDVLTSSPQSSQQTLPSAPTEPVIPSSESMGINLLQQSDYHRFLDGVPDFKVFLDRNDGSMIVIDNDNLNLQSVLSKDGHHQLISEGLMSDDFSLDSSALKMNDSGRMNDSEKSPADQQPADQTPPIPTPTSSTDSDRFPHEWSPIITTTTTTTTGEDSMSTTTITTTTGNDWTTTTTTTGNYTTTGDYTTTTTTTGSDWTTTTGDYTTTTGSDFSS